MTPKEGKVESIQEGFGPAGNMSLPPKKPGPTAAWDRQTFGWEILGSKIMALCRRYQTITLFKGRERLPSGIS